MLQIRGDMMTEMMKKPFLRAEDVAEILSISKPYAYKIIRELNEELKAKGYRTITGRINTRSSLKRPTTA